MGIILILLYIYIYNTVKKYKYIIFTCNIIHISHVG
jgi:hypothetical protein